MSWEILGTVASLIVLISFLMKGEKNIRLVNILGAVMFAGYGVMINAFSVWFLNGALVLIHIYKLAKQKILEKKNN